MDSKLLPFVKGFYYVETDRKKIRILISYYLEHLLSKKGPFFIEKGP